MIGWLKKLFKKEEQEDPILIWGILSSEDHYEDGFFMVLRISQSGRVYDARFWFNERADAKHIIEHFQETMKPLELDMKEYELVR